MCHKAPSFDLRKRTSNDACTETLIDLPREYVGDRSPSITSAADAVVGIRVHSRIYLSRHESLASYSVSKSVMIIDSVEHGLRCRAREAMI